ncbi:putative monovalent cation/H+ antiporter subunit A [Notoacmeibacter ruber]|uniref:Putative monovalent cation/H+ antiporter subunit A n=1 Tax=Notoacmeibacter ruber TaxID=2670375 RepID=A0A3L7JGA4_9HYPH|nr:putative monovalent cation/H+ antiporter subunit A [Notoacmeibacter ruber]RLQ87512.1 putative monovalent cation/H+ antiporter subunit A [Notoacmeibacter ruber]
MIALAALAVPFTAALLAPVLAQLVRRWLAVLLAVFPLALFLFWLRLVPLFASGREETIGVSWIPSFGVEFSVLIDGLSLTFALLVSGIGTLIVLFAGAYLKGDARLPRFLCYLFLFMGAMQGLVLANDLIMLFVFWELTSISSFLLIGFDRERMASRRAAIQALVVTGMGGLSLLAGFLLIRYASGASSLSEVLALGDGLRELPVYMACFILVLGGAFTKSAQFPFHFWLPNAMEAPTPVSAYLHSATMVKAGVYLLMRLQPAMGGTTAWETVLPIFGAITLLAGTILGLRQTDLKLVLAYTTVASLGLLVMLTGFGTEGALAGAVLYLIAHSLFKGGLFMVAGGIDHEAGSRDLRHLSGLRHGMPLTFAIALLCALSMGGLPPFVGFLAKEEMYYGLFKDGGWAMALLAAAIIGNGLMLALGFIVGLRPFLGKEMKAPKHAHEGPFDLWIGPAILALCGLAAGIFYHFFHEMISIPMASAVAGENVPIEISPIPHISAAFYLTLLTIAFGVGVYLLQDRLRSAIDRALVALGWGPDRGFDQAISGLSHLAHRVTYFFQNGRLDLYMTTVFCVLAFTLLFSLAFFSELPELPGWPELALHEWTILLIIVVGIGTVIMAHNRLTAIVSLGIQGFGVAVLFMLQGAPDLSFTQFMVETLSVVILALVMTRIPLAKTDHRSNPEKLIDGGIALLCGVGLGGLLLAVTQTPFDGRLSEFYEEFSRAIAHGRNIVNVIIVDFRGLDTLGEIAVVMVAGLAVLGLIRIRRPRVEDIATPVGDRS